MPSIPACDNPSPPCRNGRTRIAAVFFTVQRRFHLQPEFFEQLAAHQKPVGIVVNEEDLEGTAAGIFIMECWESNRAVIGVSTDFYRLVKLEDTFLDIGGSMSSTSPSRALARRGTLKVNYQTVL